LTLTMTPYYFSRGPDWIGDPGGPRNMSKTTLRYLAMVYCNQDEELDNEDSG
jgi:hypothetical protein